LDGLTSVFLEKIWVFVERSSTIERYHHPPPKFGNNCHLGHAILPATPAEHMRANLPAALAQFYNNFTIIIIYNFIIFKLCSTTEQMPALVSFKI
jgi:hypothetical protein